MTFGFQRCVRQCCSLSAVFCIKPKNILIDGRRIIWNIFFHSSFPPDLQNMGGWGRNLRNAQLFGLGFCLCFGKRFIRSAHFMPKRAYLEWGRGQKGLWATLNTPAFLNSVVNESPNSTGVIVIAVIGENELFSVALTEFPPSQPAGSLQTSPHASEKHWICKFCSWVYPQNLIEPFTFIITKIFAIP